MDSMGSRHSIQYDTAPRAGGCCACTYGAGYRSALGLGAFLWSMKSGQYQDLDGAAERILDEEADEKPL